MAEGKEDEWEEMSLSPPPRKFLIFFFVLKSFVLSQLVCNSGLLCRYSSTIVILEC